VTGCNGGIRSLVTGWNAESVLWWSDGMLNPFSGDRMECRIRSLVTGWKLKNPFSGDRMTGFSGGIRLWWPAGIPESVLWWPASAALHRQESESESESLLSASFFPFVLCFAIADSLVVFFDFRFNSVVARSCKSIEAFALTANRGSM
jgi:hypothetical protein